MIARLTAIAEDGSEMRARIVGALARIWYSALVFAILLRHIMYLFYIDESGNRDTQHLERERFYVLTAVGMFERNWKSFYLDLAKAKRAILDRINRENALSLELTIDAEVKSTYIRNCVAREKHPFSYYQTEAERQSLVDLFYRQLELRRATLVSVVIDKQRIKPKSKLHNQQELHNKAWELLCERIEHFMRECHDKHTAILITDDVSKQKNLQTTIAHVNLYRIGSTAGVKLKHIIEMPLFVSSATCVGVQLADLCAYNVYRRFTANDPDYPFFRKIEPYFYSSGRTPAQKTDGLKVFPPEQKQEVEVRLGLSISS